MPLRRTIDQLTPLAGKWRRAASTVRVKLRTAMAAAGVMISKESARRAPYMDGNLEAAHTTKVIRSANDGVTVEVAVGGVVNGVDVDKYVMEMHESHGISYQPGPGTLTKQAADPSVTVGRKFLERAVDDNEDEIIERLEEIILGAIT
ncbi:MAG: hypothetical protein NXH70_02605 [Hyphomonas sp.]|nr:hypothetical protein [Hyphomonas sp.]